MAAWHLFACRIWVVQNWILESFAEGVRLFTIFIPRNNCLLLSGNGLFHSGLKLLALLTRLHSNDGFLNHIKDCYA